MAGYIGIIIGFLIGFIVGQSLIFFLLKDTPKEEILNNKTLKLQYGLLNWAITILGAYLGWVLVS